MPSATIRLLAASLTLAALAGCDAAPEQARDYDTVARVDLDAVRKAAWAKALLKEGDVPFAAKGCRDLLMSADAVTLGMGNETVELYVEGTVKPKAVTACVDGLRKRESSTEDVDTKDVVKHEALGEDLHAILVGPEPLPTATHARHEALVAANPGPASQAAWLTARNTGSSSEIKEIEVWVDAKDGLDAHVGFEFTDGTDAVAFAAQAAMMLTAMRFSDETAGIAKAVDLDVKGKKISAQVHATQEMIEAALKASKEKPAKRPLSHEEMRKRAKESGGFSFSFSFG